MVATQIEGAAVYEYLQSVGKNTHEESRRLHADLRNLDGEMDRLLDDKGTALLDLARHLFPELTHQTIEATFSGIRDELRLVLNRKLRRMGEIDGQLEEIVTTRQRLDDNLLVITARLNECVAQREPLEIKAAEALKGHEEFQRLSKQAIGTDERLARDERRVQEIRREADEKLPSYENSRLFMYLYERHFGTPQYQHRGLTRTLDRWVARLIDYQHARRGYDFLRATPELMAAEVARRRSEFESHMERIEAIEDQVSDEVGLTEVLRLGDQLGKQRDDDVATLERERERAEQLTEELVKLEHSQGAFYEEAIDRYRRFLEQTETSVLERRAGLTPEPEDDQIVREITTSNDLLTSIRARTSELAKTRAAADDKVVGMDYVLDHFRRMGYDSQRSYFLPDFDAARHVESYLAGDIRRRQLWREISKNHKFRPTWAEKTAVTASDFIESEAGRVLMHAMVQVVGASMRQNVGRGMQRRGNRGQVRRLAEGRPRTGGGFTSGSGF